MKEIVNGLINDSKNGNTKTSCKESINENQFLKEYVKIMTNKSKQPNQTPSNMSTENVCSDQMNDLHGLQSMFKNLSIGLYRTSVNGKILCANTEVVRLFGFESLEELKERDLESEGFGHSTRRNNFKTLIEEKGEVIGLESCWKRKDGT